MAVSPNRVVPHGEGREELIVAAITLVANTGLRSLTYRAVAEAAGVTHGLVRYHFGSRDALIEESLRYAVQRSLDGSWMSGDVKTIDDLAAWLVDILALDPESQLFQYEIMLESRRRPVLAALVAEQYQRYWEVTRQQLEQLGFVSPDLHLAVFAAIEGLVFQEVTLSDRVRTERAISALRALLSTELRTPR